jgi:hypothetical protein
LDDALHLFRAIWEAHNTILIHFDTKFELKAYHNSSLMKEIEACPCGSHVEVASVHNCKWRSWSMNLATDAMEHGKGCHPIFRKMGRLHQPE